MLMLSLRAGLQPAVVRHGDAHAQFKALAAARVAGWRDPVGA